jgi:hypothetical protein
MNVEPALILPTIALCIVRCVRYGQTDSTEASSGSRTCRSTSTIEITWAMTQQGALPPVPTDRILPVNFPSYLYPHPSIQTLTLATVKEGMFHPSLPTFRRIDMDTTLGRLADEHCRTITRCSRGMHAEAGDCIQYFVVCRSAEYMRFPTEAMVTL